MKNHSWIPISPARASIAVAMRRPRSAPTASGALSPAATPEAAGIGSIAIPASVARRAISSARSGTSVSKLSRHARVSGLRAIIRSSIRNEKGKPLKSAAASARLTRTPRTRPPPDDPPLAAAKPSKKDWRPITNSPSGVPSSDHIRDGAWSCAISSRTLAWNWAVGTIRPCPLPSLP